MLGGSVATSGGCRGLGGCDAATGWPAARAVCHRLDPVGAAVSYALGGALGLALGVIAYLVWNQRKFPGELVRLGKEIVATQRALKAAEDARNAATERAEVAEASAAKATQRVLTLEMDVMKAREEGARCAVEQIRNADDPVAALDAFNGILLRDLSGSGRARDAAAEGGGTGPGTVSPADASDTAATGRFSRG